LLYVGVSRSAIGRMLQHSETSAWFGEVTYIRIERFKTRRAALREEKRTIQLCRPKHNITHAPTVNRIRRKLIKIYGSLDAWSEAAFKKHTPGES
jgi:predicted GIY-YIG superfamily endonuclease